MASRTPELQADLFVLEGGQRASLSLTASDNQMRLEDWPASLANVSSAWARHLSDFWQSEQGRSLFAKVSAALSAGKVVYPRTPYKALALTPFEKVRVVVLGQDPYHGPGQAEGLAFSVGAGQKIPPSLRNIFKEVQRDMGGNLPTGVHAGSLERWAAQGVLLLNTALTVEDSQPASHSRWGWEVLTDKLIQALAEDAQPRAFLLWGAHAQSKIPLIEASSKRQQHLILKANHPSPLSALRPPLPFVGSGHFGQINRWLTAQNKIPIDW
jgi:uracil-DNA glycosylase